MYGLRADTQIFYLAYENLKKNLSLSTSEGSLKCSGVQTESCYIQKKVFEQEHKFIDKKR